MPVQLFIGSLAILNPQIRKTKPIRFILLVFHPFQN